MLFYRYPNFLLTLMLAGIFALYFPAYSSTPTFSGPEILHHKKWIFEMKQRWMEKIAFIKMQNETAYSDFERILAQGFIVNLENHPGVYLLEDSDHNPCYLIKPCDERIFCLNSQIGTNKKMHQEIPLYQSVQRELITYELAKELNIEKYVPKVLIAFIESEQFFDIVDALPPHEQKTWESLKDKNKLCSVHTYIPNTQLLYDYYKKDQNPFKEHTAIFEALMILIWSIYDTDCHAGHILFQDHFNGAIYKIDHDLSFPEHHLNLRNCLASLPQVHNPLSDEAKNIIRKLPIERMIERMQFYELQTAIPAFQERMQLLKDFTSRNMTILDIDLQFRLLGLSKRKNHDLNDFNNLLKASLMNFVSGYS